MHKQTTEQMHLALLKKYFTHCVLDDFSCILKDDKNKMEKITQTLLIMLKKHLTLLLCDDDKSNFEALNNIIEQLCIAEYDVNETYLRNVNYCIKEYINNICNLNNIKIFGYLIQYHQSKNIIDKIDLRDHVDLISNKSEKNLQNEIEISLFKKCCVQYVLYDFNEILKEDKNVIESIVSTKKMLTEYLQLLHKIKNNISVNEIDAMIDDLNPDKHETTQCWINCYIQHIYNNIQDIKIIGHIAEYHETKNISHITEISNLAIKYKTLKQTKLKNTAITLCVNICFLITNYLISRYLLTMFMPINPSVQQQIALVTFSMLPSIIMYFKNKTFKLFAIN